jgi:hypothetical protein
MRWCGARAGSFTPICLVFLYNSGVGWALLGTLWLLAFCGIALTISAFDHLPKCARLRAARAHVIRARSFLFVPIVCAHRLQLGAVHDVHHNGLDGRPAGRRRLPLRRRGGHRAGRSRRRRLLGALVRLRSRTDHLLTWQP